MCFHVPQIYIDRGLTPDVAQSNIEVFKKVVPWGTVSGRTIVHSMHYGYAYMIGRIYELGFKLHVSHSQFHPATYRINEGFHSYISLEDADGRPGAFIRCIIPEGSEYYRNEHRGEIVSNAIMLSSIISNI